MLLHTPDWWPAEADGSGTVTRERLGHLFPVGMMDETARTLIAEQEWALCRRLYDYVVYRKLREGRLSTEGALGLSVANARLVTHLWPMEQWEVASATLSAMTDYAMGNRLTKKALHAIKLRLQEVCHTGGGGTCVKTDHALDAVEAVVAVIRAATQARSESDLARHVVRVLGWVESAALHATPATRSADRTGAVAAARTEVWRSAFLHLDLAVASGTARVHV